MVTGLYFANQVQNLVFLPMKWKEIHFHFCLFGKINTEFCQLNRSRCGFTNSLSYFLWSGGPRHKIKWKLEIDLYPCNCSCTDDDIITTEAQSLLSG